MRRQAPNVERMRLMGASVVPVEFGTRTLKEATSEAIRVLDATGHDWVLVETVGVGQVEVEGINAHSA